jgi:hypothetical protein
MDPKPIKIDGFTASRYQPSTWSLHGNNGMLVSINMDTGDITFGEHYTPDEAAKTFWEAIGWHVKSRDSLEKVRT